MFSDTDLDLDGYSVMVRNSPWPKPLEDHQYQGVVDVQSGYVVLRWGGTG